MNIGESLLGAIRNAAFSLKSIKTEAEKPKKDTNTDTNNLPKVGEDLYILYQSPTELIIETDKIVEVLPADKNGSLEFITASGKAKFDPLFGRDNVIGNTIGVFHGPRQFAQQVFLTQREAEIAIKVALEESSELVESVSEC